MAVIGCRFVLLFCVVMHASIFRCKPRIRSLTQRIGCHHRGSWKAFLSRLMMASGNRANHFDLIQNTAILTVLPDCGAKGDDMSLNKRSKIVSGFVLACLAVALSSISPAYAGCISQTLDNTTYYTCDGKLGVSQTIGGTIVHNFDGKLSTSQTVGATTVHNFDGKFGVSQTVGATTIHNLDGKFGMSQTIGEITVHSGPLFDSR